MVEFIEDYDALTVEEVVERLSDLNVGQLEALAQHERENKDRVTLLGDINDELESRSSGEDGGEADDSSGGVDSAADDDGSGYNDEVGDDGRELSGDEETESSGEEEPRIITVRANVQGLVGGVFFDAPGETAEVRDNDLRVIEALEDGDLEQVG